MARKKSVRAAGDAETPIEALVHKDTRKNIPPVELSELVAEEEETPQTMLYPRDPTLDPQLVWKGKDEQDQKDLAVPVVPIYIQEKILPKALIEDLRARASGKKPQLGLFAALEPERPFEEQVEYYKHDDKWTNRMILGDSLVVMTSLAQKEGLKGKVQMVYIDPPYGIKFGSNWQVSTRKREVKDGKIEDLIRQPEQIKAFRDTWERGIHSYLAYMRDRLAAARELLSDSGSVFVQISDENVHIVRSLLDEIFGANNMAGFIPFVTTGGLGASGLPSVCDYLLWYAKDLDRMKFRKLYASRLAGESGADQYTSVELPDGERRRMTPEEQRDPSRLPPGSRCLRFDNLTSGAFRENTTIHYEFEGKRFHPGTDKCWKTTKEGLDTLAASRRLHAIGNTLTYVRYIDDFAAQPFKALWLDTGTSGFGDEKLYVVQTNKKVIERCMLMTTDPGDLVLDPTCGSGTTAQVAEAWGRRWITIDTSRVAIAIAKARLIGARFPYYLLLDTAEGARKSIEQGVLPPSDADRPWGGDIRAAFVYKRLPHITLGSIANNLEVRSIISDFDARLAPLREKLDKLLGKKWQEWEIPREAGASWTNEQKACHAEWWELRRARPKEIDASIARRAESEVLYDQPYEDPKRIRVSGPFTVESLSPHRMLDASRKKHAKQSIGEAGTSFVTTILDNLKKAGVQNTVKNERLVFDRLNPFPGGWIHAEGEYKHKSGAVRRAAISIGPEHGTVGRDQVKKAAEEARKGQFDLVVVCGFAFDAHAYETALEISPKQGSDPPPGKPGGPTPGAIAVLLSRMNPDLAMGDELLKKTGAGNLFMVFGEPDIQLQKSKDGKYIAEIRGLDVYDPTTGEIRSHTTDDIACWFIDTDYSGDSFFVRHAYFTGASDPYEKLKRALKAEIDEEAWASLYTTKSRPFDPPKSGLIAIKVINHYGDEVLKVYNVP